MKSKDLKTLKRVDLEIALFNALMEVGLWDDYKISVFGPDEESDHYEIHTPERFDPEKYTHKEYPFQEYELPILITGNDWSEGFDDPKNLEEFIEIKTGGILIAIREHYIPELEKKGFKIID